MVETTTPVAPQSGAPGESAAMPAGMPSGMSSGFPEVPADEAGVSSLLDKLAAGGEKAQEPAPAPGEGKEPEPLKIPDKFKNPDGTVNTEALTKSYLEAEKQLGQHFQMRSDNQKMHEQLAQMQDYIKRIDEWREQTLAQQKGEERPDGEYTPEEIEEMQKNPRSFIQKEVQKNLKTFQQEQAEEAKLNRDINEAINYGRANVDGFKTLEPEIAKLMESPAYSRHPESVQQAYYATLGQKTPELIRQSKNMGFTEGYNKAKEEMSKHVESGGKSSMPVDAGSLTPDTIKDMSLEDMEKIIPTIDTRILRNSAI